MASVRNTAQRGRRLAWLSGFGLGCALFGLALVQSARAQEVEITVFKSPTCVCCARWMAHLREAGFAARGTELPQMGPIKARFGVPPKLLSCHTAVVDGYVIEGHVPADLIKRLLKERLRFVGLAAPGMPPGSPGMESSKPERYDILSFDEHGVITVYARR